MICINREMVMYERIFRFFRVIRNYKNPIRLFLHQRFVSDDGVLRVHDRSTGLRFDIKPGAFKMFSEVFHLHIYDIPFVPIRPGDIVMDIGANHGFYSIYAASQGATVYAFEPQADTYQFLLRNIELNHMQGRVLPFQMAIGGLEGHAELAVAEELAGGMSTIHPSFAENIKITVKERYEVVVDTLTNVIEKFAITRVRCCKLDCEGAELDIIKSLSVRSISQFDSMAIEYHPQAYDTEDLIDILLDSGQVQISTLDTNLHYKVGGTFIHCTNTEVVRETFQSQKEQAYQMSRND